LNVYRAKYRKGRAADQSVPHAERML
jgi:hypothetical protein